LQDIQYEGSGRILYAQGKVERLIRAHAAQNATLNMGALTDEDGNIYDRASDCGRARSSVPDGCTAVSLSRSLYSFVIDEASLGFQRLCLRQI
jgi:hypothetical protein